VIQIGHNWKRSGRLEKNRGRIYLPSHLVKPVRAIVDEYKMTAWAFNAMKAKTPQ